MEHYSGTVKVELDPSNNAAKGDLNWTAGVDTSNLAAKSDLATFKTWNK